MQYMPERLGRLRTADKRVLSALLHISNEEVLTDGNLYRISCWQLWQWALPNLQSPINIGEEVLRVRYEIAVEEILWFVIFI